METTIFGKTGRKVSRIGFGGATAGIPNYIKPFDPSNPDDRKPIIDAIGRAYELGINYFDTAAAYGDGASERIFGEGLAHIPSDRIFLATKVTPTSPKKLQQAIDAGRITQDDAVRFMRSADGIADPCEIRASVERSLTNLKKDYVDLIQLHGTFYSEAMARELLREGGAVDELYRLKEEGLVKYIGFTIEAQNTGLDLLLESGRFDTMQIQYNLLFQHPYDPYFHSGSLYDAKQRNMGVAAMRTATSGLFQKWIQTVNPENTFDYTPALIQFVLSCPCVDVALLGMRSVQRVEQNVAIANDLTGRIDIGSMHYRITKKS